MFIRKIFNYGTIYSKFQTAIGKQGIRESFIFENIGDFKNKNILDLGCGTADILSYIEQEKKYVGIDNNMNYINFNNHKFSNRKTCSFFYGDLNDYIDETIEKFDIVLMLGVMHHIDNEALQNLLMNIKKILKPGGVFISHDPCLQKKMNPIAKKICKLDRGQYVRYEEEYVDILKRYFSKISYIIKKDTLKLFPYSVIYFANRFE